MSLPPAHPLDTVPTAQAIARVLEDYATSNWLKDAIRSALRRDPVDAHRDTTLLSYLLERHCDDQLQRSSPLPPH